MFVPSLPPLMRGLKWGGANRWRERDWERGTNRWRKTDWGEGGQTIN